MSNFDQNNGRLRALWRLKDGAVSVSTNLDASFSQLEVLFRIVSLERCLRKPLIDSRQRLLALGSFIAHPMVDRRASADVPFATIAPTAKMVRWLRAR